MNGIFWIIFVALLLDYFIGLFSTILNLRQLRSIPPAELEDVFAIDEYARSQEYTRVRSRFGLVSSSKGLVMLLIFWLIGGFNYIDELSRLIGWNEISSGITFIGIIAVVTFISNLPFDLYSTFVIEERFGFNKTTYLTYVLDTLKGLLLSVVIGVPLLSGVLYFFEYMGSVAWLYVWVFVTFVSLVLSVVVPVWIMPLFNKFTLLQPGILRESIVEYAKKVDFKFGNIYIIDRSRRSAHSNAFFTGFGKTKRIALFDTLVDQLSVEEILSVIAHEVGHNKKRHVVYGLLLGILHTGALLFLLSLTIENKLLFEAFFMDNVSIYASIVFFGLLMTPIELAITPLMQLVSRRHEYEADRWAVQTTADRSILVSGLKKLAANNLSNLSPHPLFVVLHYSHPPLLERIKAIKSQADKAYGQ